MGVPCLTLLLLLRCRHALLSTQGPPTPLSRATRFLHAEYRKRFFWWEVGETLRKLVSRVACARVPATQVRLVTCDLCMCVAQVFVGLMTVVFTPGTPAQLLSALLLALLWLVARLV